MTTTQTSPPTCEIILEANGPNAGCAQYMTAPDEWTCGAPGAVRFTIRADHPAFEEPMLTTQTTCAACAAEVRAAGDAHWEIVDEEPVPSPEAFAFVEIVEKVLASSQKSRDTIMPLLSADCPECGEAPAPAGATGRTVVGGHILIGACVVVCCQGYIALNPATVGVPKPGGTDANGNAPAQEAASAPEVHG